MSTVNIGLDPGMTGAIAAVYGGTYKVEDIPTFKVVTGRKRSTATGKMIDKFRTEMNIPEILSIIKRYRDLSDDVHAWIEAVHSMPDQGVRSMFSMGEGFGILKCALAATSTPYTIVHPATWKKFMMSGMGKEKEASVYRALQIWPNADLVGPKGGKKHGRADALLIARYGETIGQHG